MKIDWLKTSVWLAMLVSCLVFWLWAGQQVIWGLLLPLIHHMMD